MTTVSINSHSIADYQKFLNIRRLPTYRIDGIEATFPDCYADRLGMPAIESAVREYNPSPFLFDYQAAIATLAIRKRKFAAFVECGLGKTLILLEFARHAVGVTGGPFLIISPLMVIRQTLAEAKRFYPDMQIEQVRSADLQAWLLNGTGIGITNYESLNQDLAQDLLTGLACDESSLLKSHYGKWGQAILNLGAGLQWKLALTGTPAPNDRIEYANHAVFLDASKTVNEFLARYFVNRGQTNERWELKPHALEPFYRDLTHWCIFLSDPSVYGWKDNSETVPPIHVHIHQVGLTDGQRQAAQDLTGRLMVSEVGGIGTRSKLGQIAKGKGCASLKPEFIRDLVGSWPDESTIIWCLYNDEQDGIAKLFPDAANIDGSTPFDNRVELIDDFKSGRRKVLISKPKILGFGLNLQVATRQVFSGLQDSYESYWQAVKRSNRVGSTLPLNVHIPVTELEEPMVANVLRKAHMVEADTAEQQRIFRENHSRCL